AHLVLAGMDLMAGGTGNAAGFMDTARPVVALAVLLVAAQTGIVALGDRRLRVLVEGTLRLRGLVTALVVGVGVALAMATGATRGSAIGMRAMASLADGQQLWRVRLVVAGRALGVALEDGILGCFLDWRSRGIGP